MKTAEMKRMLALAFVGCTFTTVAFANTPNNGAMEKTDTVTIANIDKAVTLDMTDEEPLLVYAEDAWTIHSGISPDEVTPENVIPTTKVNSNAVAEAVISNDAEK